MCVVAHWLVCSVGVFVRLPLCDVSFLLLFWLQGGGGPFAVVAYGQYGRFDPSSPVVSGHSAAVLDFEWNPFHDEILASASEDSTIKVGGQQKKIRVALSATSAC